MTYKGYRIEPLGTYPMFEIKQNGRGHIPAALEGVFSKVFFAERQIDQYLDSLTNKKKRTKKDDKENSASSG